MNKIIGLKKSVHRNTPSHQSCNKTIYSFEGSGIIEGINTEIEFDYIATPGISPGVYTANGVRELLQANYFRNLNHHHWPIIIIISRHVVFDKVLCNTVIEEGGNIDIIIIIIISLR